MLDQWMQELFGDSQNDPRALPPNANPLSGPAPDSFNQRFAPAAMAMQPPGAPPPGPNALSAPPPNGGIPLPQPRPDIEALLAGRNAMPPVNPGPGAMPAPGAMSAPGAMPPGGPGGVLAGLMAKLSGTAVNPTALTKDDTPASGVMGRLLGQDTSGEKRIRSALAGGFANANPAFKFGAFQKGTAGALTGGLTSDKQDTDAETAADAKTQAQSNFERAQKDKELTSEAQRKLAGSHANYYDNVAATPGGRTNNAWNKPPHERYKDAVKLIQDERKAIFGAINPLGPKADVERQRAEAQKKIDEFKARTFKTYGIDENGNDVAPQPTPGGPAKPKTMSTSKVIGDDEAANKGLYPKGTYDDPYKPASKEEFDAIPPGGLFVNPSDGQIMTKRGTPTP